MRRTLFTAACVAALLAAGSASARDIATLTDVKGSVLVGNDKGFREISATTGLKAGDRVVVAAASSAVLSYGADCSVALPSNADITITEQSCTVGTQNGPVSFLGPFRPLMWGIITGIASFIGAVI